MKHYQMAFVLALSLSPSFADVISGKVTDLATKAPLAGVKVGSGTALVLTGADGSYSLNTAAPTSVAPDRRLAEIAWDVTAGAFRWDGLHGRVRIEVRDMGGRLVDRAAFQTQSGTQSYRFRDGAHGLLLVSVRSEAGSYAFRMNRVGNMAVLLKEEEAPGRAGVRALVKVSALNKVAFNHTGYDVYSQNVDGNKSGFDIAMHKTGSLTWRKARMTWYTSYPDPKSEECVKYNGCTWAGQFAALGKKPESWVAEHNLVAVHSRDYGKYKLKTLRLKHKDFLIDAQVVDMCADSDCNGCCTENANTGGGFLIDLESYGTKRFGLDDGSIEWTCIDCT